MPAGYAPLSNPRSAPDAERELEDAFDLDDDQELEQEAHGDSESTPLTRNPESHLAETSSSRHETTALPGGTYDFEREYDFPPPGSPPPPSSQALPNDYGNSNGLLPTAPVGRPQPRRSIFRRILGTVLPSQYQPVSTESHSTRLTGGGTENDGVFANVTAKPQPGRVVLAENGDMHVVPEDSQKEMPPTYQEAQLDTVPPYWETTVHAPAGMDPNADLIIEDLPTGSFLIFCLNVFISFFFQFVGFLLTYLLHTSHAAKFGSRAGLGLTLIQYGLYSRSMNFVDDPNADGTGAQGSEGSWIPDLSLPGDAMNATAAAGPTPTQPGPETISTNSKDWLSFLFMTLGWFLLLSSCLGFWKVKRWEKSIRPRTEPITADDIERDRNVRQNLEDVFGFVIGDASRHTDRDIVFHHPGLHEQSAVADERLARDLRVAGLI